MLKTNILCPTGIHMWSLTLKVFFFYLYFLAGQSVLATFLLFAHFTFLRDVWILNQRAALTSGRANNLATRLPKYGILPKNVYGNLYFEGKFSQNVSEYNGKQFQQIILRSLLCIFWKIPIPY